MSTPRIRKPRPRLTDAEKAARKQARKDAERAESRRLAKELVERFPLRPDEVPLLTRLIRGAASASPSAGDRGVA